MMKLIALEQIVLRETRRERMAKKKGPEMVKARRSSGKWQRRDARQRKTMKGKRLSAKRAGPHVPELANDRMDIDDDMDGCTPAFLVTSMHHGGEAENVLYVPLSTFLYYHKLTFNSAYAPQQSPKLRFWGSRWT